MKNKERIIWISATTVLLGLLLVAFLSPVAFAQSYRQSHTDKYVKELEAALNVIENYYVDEVDTAKLFKGAMDGMFAALNDPYSLYMDTSISRKMEDTTTGKYGGVGIYISKEYYDPENPNGRLPYVKVVSPIEGTPSWDSGINAGDYIYAIEGESAEGYSTEDVSNRLRGTPGTRVKVTLLRGRSTTFDVTLTRALIEIPTVKTTVINGKNGKIGYLRIIEFTPFSEPRVKDALSEFADMDLEQLIIDVRNNPGGVLNSVVKIADHFFSGGVIVSTKSRMQDQDRVYRATPGKLIPSYTKIVVLVNKGSASASEILTGAMKDRDRATIIGNTTYGKGSVQQILSLMNSKDKAIKLTTGRYYTPHGENIDKTGIEPDIFVKVREFSDEETKDLATVFEENRIGRFVNANPRPTENTVNIFLENLRADGLTIDDDTIRRLIKIEYNRHLNVPPVVDMEYDKQLIRAVEFFDTGK